MCIINKSYNAQWGQANFNPRPSAHNLVTNMEPWGPELNSWRNGGNPKCWKELILPHASLSRCAHPQRDSTQVDTPRKVSTTNERNQENNDLYNNSNHFKNTRCPRCCWMVLNKISEYTGNSSAVRKYDVSIWKKNKNQNFSRRAFWEKLFLVF